MTRQIIHNVVCIVAAFACLIVSITALDKGIHEPQNVQTSAACAATVSTPDDQPSDAQAALKAYDAVQKCMSTNVDLYWLAYFQQGGQYAPAWSIGQIIEGTLAVSRLPGAPSSAAIQRQLDLEVHGLSYYWDPDANPPGYDSSIRAPFGSGSDKYYDDNNWIAISLLQTYKYTHQSWLLSRAEDLFKLEKHGTINTQNYPHPGGVFWTQKPGDFYRATVSTAGAVQFAVQLYLVTHKIQYLQFALNEYQWVNATLLAPNGLYWDGINPDGSPSTTQWSYNQGLMIGDNTLLYLATGEQQYLEQAESITEKALAHYSDANNLLSAQPPEFNAIFFKNLMLLHSVAPNPAYRAALVQYAALVWSHMNSRTGVFFWNGQSTLLQQGAAIQVFAYLTIPEKDINLT